jgi:hypothetical protein
METNSKVNAKGSLAKTVPEKVELAQRTRRPPEAPTEGTYSNLSNRRGANFLMKAK